VRQSTRRLDWRPLRLTLDFVAYLARSRHWLIGDERSHRVRGSLLLLRFGGAFLAPGMFFCFRTSAFGHTFTVKLMA
jgi:hypothetical protein